ncbi:hypothetical protein [Bacillus phage SP8]|uniref:Uncharacterized protein n=1 Tax=Bacillus phage Adastra TaxID=3143958 RepID=A0AAU8BCQ4_9CAUD|nr:hypothetical protein [Bacillus phage SP8]
MENYPLKQCSSCSHRRVCRIMDDLQYLLDTQLLPIDFSPSKCEEYSEDYNLSIKNRLSHAIEEVKVEGEHAMRLINFIEDKIHQFRQQGINIMKVILHSEAYNLVKGHDFTIELEVNDSIDPGDCLLVYDIQDEEDE